MDDGADSKPGLLILPIRSLTGQMHVWTNAVFFFGFSQGLHRIFSFCLGKSRFSPARSETFDATNDRWLQVKVAGLPWNNPSIWRVLLEVLAGLLLLLLLYLQLLTNVALLNLQLFSLVGVRKSTRSTICLVASKSFVGRTPAPMRTRNEVTWRIWGRSSSGVRAALFHKGFEVDQGGGRPDF